MQGRSTAPPSLTRQTALAVSGLLRLLPSTSDQDHIDGGDDNHDDGDHDDHDDDDHDDYDDSRIPSAKSQVIFGLF